MSARDIVTRAGPWFILLIACVAVWAALWHAERESKKGNSR
jgi:hypothetical protein